MADWFVRPDTTHNTTRNGLSYDTAWGGWSEIVWGSLAAGDTLYACGTFNLTSTIAIGAHGGTATNRVTVSGGYAPARGYITVVQSGGVFLISARANTRITGFRFQNLTSNAIFVGSAATNCLYDFNTFVAVSGSGPLIGLDSATGNNHNGVYVRNNIFTGVSSTNGGSALNWFPTIAINSTLTDIQIEDNIFTNITSTTARGVIHFRVQNDANVASKMVRIRVNRNQFLGYSGVAMELNSGFNTFAQSQGLEVRSNTFANGREAAAGVGGCMSIWGFGTDDSMGKPVITGNTFTDVQGAAGFANVFFGNYEIYGNSGRNLTTTTIDGNGVLFDYGCQYARAYANRFFDIRGKVGAVNSGVGVMVLDSTNVEVFGNYVEGCLTGVFYGNLTGNTTGQSSSIYNNTFIGCRNNGVYGLSTMDKTTNTFQNNIVVAATNTAVSVNNNGATWTSTETNNTFFGFSGTSNHTLNGSDSTANPVLSTGFPTTSTPVGVFIKPQIDGQLSAFWNPPTCGAYEVVRPRTQRT